ncbi:beta-lactamase family protein [Aquimarina sp. ERC-38]|uniref:serine hydrolase domain-containing protein n=1 Tax=Aquimarina sp. ERC-38 TaxID=2949996 RepID=UPI002245D0D0|nr:serine hydrolase domain-containing protein [Aquimarina sp. ERC-38]UZO80641.1 beta-lactamase family protein [Aquimarina sp. ERC-38]
MGDITILKDGKKVYNKSVGYQYINEEQKKEITIASKFRVGSVTKTFTAVMIFQLLDENKIALNNKLSQYYPKIPSASKITIANLLSHRSGLFDITNDPTVEEWIYKPSSEKEMISRIVKHKAVFQPSEKTSYSNTNYILLGYILEQIEGKPYKTILQERITNKLGLKNTYVGSSIDIYKNECLSYRYEEEDNNALVKVAATDLSNPGGAGNIVSNTLDLTTFITALFNKNLITEESLKLMTTTADHKEFCYGIFYNSIKGLDVYASEGSIDRFQSALIYVPKTKVAIAFNSNALNYKKIMIVLYALDASQGKEITLPVFDKN